MHTYFFSSATVHIVLRMGSRIDELALKLSTLAADSNEKISLLVEKCGS